MRKYLLFLLFLSLSQYVYADQITFPTIWAVNDTVTNVKLNNDNNAVSNVVNGNLDNTNMKSGYSLFQTVAILPTAGTQGRVDFLTSDNSLNLDTGAAWVKTITPLGTPQTGSVAYYNGGWQLLNPGAQYLSIVSNGISSLPSYQVLPVNGGGTGQDFSTGTSGNVLYFSSTGVIGSKLQTFTPTNIQVFSTPGTATWTKPSNISTVYVKAWGAGGGGGEGNGANTRCGGGGGPGGYSEGFTGVTGNVTVTIGTGGAGGNGGTVAADGTLSSFAGTTTLTANGGSKGVSDTSSSAGGAAGSASNGSINITGTAGQSCNASGTTLAFGGSGGSPFNGSGGYGCATNTGCNGQVGGNPGGGGGGGARANTTDAIGGSGSNGMVIVYY